MASIRDMWNCLYCLYYMHVQRRLFGLYYRRVESGLYGLCYMHAEGRLFGLYYRCVEGASIDSNIGIYRRVYMACNTGG